MATNRQIIMLALSPLGPRATAVKLGISPRWVYTLLARYRAEGEAAFEPRSKRPLSSPASTPEPIRRKICELRLELAERGDDNGADTIAYWLTQEGLTAPSRATIHRILREAGLVCPQPKKRPKASYLRFQAAQPNEMWQADFTHVQLADGTDVEVLDILDDHSRFLLHLSAYPHVTGPIVVTSFAATFHEHGQPASVLTDNGLVFTARFARGGGDNAKNGLENLLHIHGIRQINGRPGHPQTQGKIERFHQTLKKWLAAQPTPTTRAGLEELLTRFQQHYNTRRPHGAIGRRTPAVAYAALPKAAPGDPLAPEARLREDTVGKDGKVTLRYAGKLRHLGIGRAWKGRKVRILVIGDEAIVALEETAEVIAEYDLDPTKNYHAKRPHAADQRTRTNE